MRIAYDLGGAVMASTREELLARLPDTFRFSEALDYMSERQFRHLVADGSIEAFARGLYRKQDWQGDEDLVEIAAKAPAATLCLRSALTTHDLIDDIPARIDIAIPTGAWTPRTIAPVKWHHFDPDTFAIGRESMDIGAGRTIGIYSPERSIIDAYRMRHLGSHDMANEALKRWLRRRGQPSILLEMAKAFPHAQPAIRQALEILL